MRVFFFMADDYQSGPELVREVAGLTQELKVKNESHLQPIGLKNLYLGRHR